MNKTEFLERRKKGIGGSDASAILEISPYKNKLQLFLEKTGQNILQEKESEYAHFGNVLEDVVAKEFERRTGKKVQRYNKLIQHKNYDFIIGNIDRKIVGEKAFLECKTASEYKNGSWSEEEIPQEYYAQIQHYLAILEYEKCYVAVLIGGNKFKYYEILRNEEYIENLIKEEVHFWNEHVLKKIPPEIDGHEFTKNFLNERFSMTVAQTATVTNEIETTLKKIAKIKNEIEKMTTEKTKYENIVRDFMQDNETAENGKFKISYKFQTRNTFNSAEFKKRHKELYQQFLKESSTRVLKITERNE